MKTVSCTAKELCTAAGISAATFSRYKSGERVPEYKSDTFYSLCGAIADAAQAKGIPDITKESVADSFLDCDDLVFMDKSMLRQNFNALITTLGINITRLCRHANYDVSTVFRIRNGSRTPSDPERFADAVASFVAIETRSSGDIEALSGLMECEVADIVDESARFSAIKGWLLTNKSEKKSSDISDFLGKLNEFDLNEYIKAIKFDELKVPTLPFQLPSSKTYFGIKEMQESELDFLKATVLSKSSGPVTMYSDMPMSEMANDKDFAKKWMFGMALMLKKGLHLNQIHNLDRSFEDMMLGLESWIPMYMTGQISPYYLRNVQNNVFSHLLKVSSAAALSGEAINGYHADGKYYLTKSKKEIEYYAKRADELLKNASPLMEIYRSDKQKELGAFLLGNSCKAGRRRNIMSTLPLYTASSELLESMIKRHALPGETAAAIMDSAKEARRRIENVLGCGTVEDEIPCLTKEEFSASPLSLDLSLIFCETDVTYTYDEYQRHLKETKEFAANHDNYTLVTTGANTFHNLQINIFEDQWVKVSKSKAPAIHFCIRHPKLRGAIENFVPPMVESSEE